MHLQIIYEPHPQLECSGTHFKCSNKIDNIKNNDLELLQTSCSHLVRLYKVTQSQKSFSYHLAQHGVQANNNTMCLPVTINNKHCYESHYIRSTQAVAKSLYIVYPINKH